MFPLALTNPIFPLYFRSCGDFWSIRSFFLGRQCRNNRSVLPQSPRNHSFKAQGYVITKQTTTYSRRLFLPHAIEDAPFLFFCLRIRKHWDGSLVPSVAATDNEIGSVGATLLKTCRRTPPSRPLIERYATCLCPCQFVFGLGGFTPPKEFRILSKGGVSHFIRRQTFCPTPRKSSSKSP